MDAGEDEAGVERDGERSHLRFLRREEFKVVRGNVITVEGYLFLIQEWVIVRRPVQLHAKG